MEILLTQWFLHSMLLNKAIISDWASFFLSPPHPPPQYFEHVEEAEWAVEVLKTTGKPVAATLCIGPEGDLNGVSPGDCAVRLVKAGTTSLCHRARVSSRGFGEADEFRPEFQLPRSV